MSPGEGLQVAPPRDAADAERFRRLTFPRYAGALVKAPTAGESTVAVGASRGEEPLGLVLGEVGPEPDALHVLSIAVAAGHEREGIGRALGEGLIALARAQGLARVVARFERGRAHSAAVEGLARALGFGAPRFRALLGRCHEARLRQAPWLGRRGLPSGFEVFPWVDLPSAARATLPKHPDVLSPFADEASIEPRNSLGLSLRGDVVGWQVTHRVVHDTVRYTALFVREDLQAHGLAVPLLVESIHQHIDGPLVAEAPRASFIVHDDVPAMLRFVRRRLGPWAEALNEVVEVERALT